MCGGQLLKPAETACDRSSLVSCTKNFVNINLTYFLELIFYEGNIFSVIP
jgi:hypothetical protein